MERISFEEKQYMFETLESISHDIGKCLDKKSDEFIKELKLCSKVYSDLIEYVNILQRDIRWAVSETFKCKLQEIILNKVEREIKKEMESLPITK